jgi:hypothetical protein
MELPPAPTTRVAPSEIAPGERSAPQPVAKMPPPPVEFAEEHAATLAAPHRLELTYVYEVDAVEMPEMESQVVAEDEPEISISERRSEALDDEALPFEARPAAEKSQVQSAQSEVRGPKSEVQSATSEAQSPGSEAPPAPRQPRLPGVE